MEFNNYPVIINAELVKYNITNILISSILLQKYLNGYSINPILFLIEDISLELTKFQVNILFFMLNNFHHRIFDALLGILMSI